MSNNKRTFVRHELPPRVVTAKNSRPQQPAPVETQPTNLLRGIPGTVLPYGVPGTVFLHNGMPLLGFTRAQHMAANEEMERQMQIVMSDPAATGNTE